MSKPATFLGEVGNQRFYWFKKEDRTIDGVRYAKVRVYTLTDRWRRTKDSWYRTDEPAVYKFTWYHPYGEEVNTWLEVPGGEDPEDYWDKARAQMYRGSYKLQGGYASDSFLDMYEKPHYEGIEKDDGEVGSVVVYSARGRYSYTMDADLVLRSKGSIKKTGATKPWKQSIL